MTTSKTQELMDLRTDKDSIKEERMFGLMHGQHINGLSELNTVCSLIQGILTKDFI